MLFHVQSDNPEGAAHQLQLFGGILTQIAQRAHSGQHDAAGSSRFHRGGIDSGAVLRVRSLTQRALHGKVINPTGKGYHFLSEVPSGQLPSVRYDGSFFRAAAEVHPAQLIQLCLPDGLFHDSRSFSFPAGARFSASCSAGDVSVHYRQEV